MTDLVSERGGTIYRIDAEGRLPDRAALLRQVCRRAEGVILYTHPYDAIAPAALGEGNCEVPVVYVNHSDLAFWTGVDSSWATANFRHVGHDLAIRRRGVAAENVHLLPIPLSPTRPAHDGRGASRAHFGIADGQCILVSAAAGYKFQAELQMHLAEVLAPILESYRHVRLFLAGTSPTPEWETLQRAAPGQVEILGPLDGVDRLLQAGDIYLDSWPFSSLTSMLEAADHGLPVVAFDGAARMHPLLGPDDPALNESAVLAADLEDYRRRLGELIEDEKRREQAGDSARRAVVRVHSGASWLAEETSALRIARSARNSPPEAPSAPGFRVEQEDVALLRLQRESGRAFEPEDAVAANYRLLRLPSRVAVGRTISVKSSSLARTMTPEAPALSWLLRLRTARGGS